MNNYIQNAVDILHQGYPVKSIIISTEHIYCATSTNNMLLIVCDNNRPFIQERIPLENISKCDIVENISTITDTGTGNSILGGILFGETGAIIGATTRNQKDYLVELSVQIFSKNNAFYINPIKVNDSKVEKQDPKYSDYKRIAALIENGINTAISESKQVSADNSQNNYDVGSKLKELNNLKDTGLITDDEYSRLRKDILSTFIDSPTHATPSKKIGQTPTKYRGQQHSPECYTSSSWVCACGYTNPGVTQYCLNCNSKKTYSSTTKTKIIHEAVFAPSNKWICSCGFKNSMSIDYCVSCGKKRIK